MSATGAHLDLLRLLVTREVRVRYARAALGVAWAVVQPAVFVAVLAGLGFARFIEGSPTFQDVPYACFAFTGFVFWLHFQQSLLTGTTALAVAHDVLHKSRFPAELIPMARVLSWLLDLGIGLVLLAILLAVQGAPVHWTAALVPLAFIAQFLFASGLVMLLSAVNLFFRDVHYMLQAFMPLLLFASNVAYPLDRIEGPAGTLFRLNPVVSYLDAYRHLIFLGDLPPMDSMWAGIVGATVVPAVGWAYFRRVSPRFAEEV